MAHRHGKMGFSEPYKAPADPETHKRLTAKEVRQRTERAKKLGTEPKIVYVDAVRATMGFVGRLAQIANEHRLHPNALNPREKRREWYRKHKQKLIKSGVYTPSRKRKRA